MLGTYLQYKNPGEISEREERQEVEETTEQLCKEKEECKETNCKEGPSVWLKTLSTRRACWTEDNSVGQDHTAACNPLDPKADPVSLWDPNATNNRNICTFQNAAQSLLKFCQMSQARQGLAQRPHRKRGDPTGELGITRRRWCLLWVTPELPSGLDALTLKYDWYLAYLSLKSLHIFYRNGHFILFPWPNFAFGEPHFSDPSSRCTFNHPLLNTFYQLTQLRPVMGLPWFILKVTVGSQHCLNPCQRKAPLHNEDGLRGNRQNHLSHIFLWNILCSQELIHIPHLEDETPSLIFFFNKYHENIVGFRDLYRDVWQAFQGCQR